MKYLIICLILVLVFNGCSSLSHRGAGSTRVNSPHIADTEESEKEEYELTIIDPGFDSWFATSSKPAGYYSLAHYENRNQRYVQAWNEKVTQQIYYRTPNYPFENKIDYDYTVDYGLELNYKLYYYFRYIESTVGDRYNFPG